VETGDGLSFCSTIFTEVDADTPVSRRALSDVPVVSIALILTRTALDCNAVLWNKLELNTIEFTERATELESNSAVDKKTLQERK